MRKREYFFLKLCLRDPALAPAGSHSIVIDPSSESLTYAKYCITGERIAQSVR